MPGAPMMPPPAVPAPSGITNLSQLNTGFQDSNLFQNTVTGQANPTQQSGFFDNPMNVMAGLSLANLGFQAFGPQQGTAAVPKQGTPKTRRFFRKEVFPETERRLDESEFGIIPNIAKPILARVRSAMTNAMNQSNAAQRSREIYVNQRGRGVPTGRQAAGIVSQGLANADINASLDLQKSDIMLDTYRQREGQFYNVADVQRRQAVPTAMQANAASREADIYQRAKVGSFVGGIPQSIGMIQLAEALYA